MTATPGETPGLGLVAGCSSWSPGSWSSSLSPSPSASSSRSNWSDTKYNVHCLKYFKLYLEVYASGGQRIPRVPLLMSFYRQLFSLPWQELNFFLETSLSIFMCLSDTNETIIEWWPPIMALVSHWSCCLLVIAVIFRLSRNTREPSSSDLGDCCQEEPRDQVS